MEKGAILLSFVFLLSVAAEGHNITAILDAYPDYSLYNSYLTQTKVADEVNSRETVTCLVLPNAAMSALAAKHTLAGIKNALRLLILLDYFDPQKLHGIPQGTTLTTTLYQTTGNAPGNLGFVNITNIRGGRVAFGSTSPGSKLDSEYTKSVRQIPYNISVLEISAPIVFPGLMDAPSSSANLTALLEKAGCKTFASLIASSGVLKIYQGAMDKGLTLFAPNDEAFKAPGVPDLSKLSSAELVTLLQYHALPSYNPKDSLKASTHPIPTMATSSFGKFDLSVTAHGDDVTLNTGVDTSRVANTVLDDTPVCVLAVDNILLPVELFGAGPSPAPGPSSLSPSPSPAATAPAPESAKAPSPMPLSPPAPPMAAPEGSPADSPNNSAADKSPEKATAVAMKPFPTLAAVVSASLALSFLL